MGKHMASDTINWQNCLHIEKRPCERIPPKTQILPLDSMMAREAILSRGGASGLAVSLNSGTPCQESSANVVSLGCVMW